MSQPFADPPRPIRMDDLKVERHVEGTDIVTYYVRKSDGQRVPLQPTIHHVLPSQLDPPPS